MLEQDTLFDETALGPPGAPSDRRAKGPDVIDLEELLGEKPAPKGGKKPTKKETEAAELADELVSEMQQFGTMITLIAPTAGAFAFSESDEAMHALVDLAKDNPRAMDSLRMVAKASPGIKCGKFTVGLAVAALVDFGKIHPDAMPARALGVTKMWVKPHPKEAEANGIYTPEPAPGSTPSL
jgi:hypothetical protein